MKKIVIVFFTGCMLLQSLGAWAQGAKTDPIESIGIYTFSPSPLPHYSFWKACGYNTYQLIDGSLSLPQEKRAKYYRELDAALKAAKGTGLKVGVILLSNIDFSPALPIPFSPANQDMVNRRIAEIEFAVKQLPHADFFTFFGGDPGGSPQALGKKGVEIWMDMARRVKEIVARNAPRAMYNASLWAIAHFEHIDITPFGVEFWDKEVLYSKMMLDAPEFIDQYCGVEFPIHNYYRSLALKAYDDAGKKPEKYPIQQDIQMLKKRGVKRYWGWAHFLIDEVDDGYTGYSGVKSHPSQAETRYLHRIVADAREIGLNGMISNTEGDGTMIEAMNIYAFGRFCRDKNLTAQQVIDEYAGYLAGDGSSKKKLGQVIRFIENHSTWEASIPAKFRIESLPCSLGNAEEALKALATVKPNLRPGFPIPEPAAKYFLRLKDRLNDIKGS